MILDVLRQTTQSTAGPGSHLAGRFTRAWYMIERVAVSPRGLRRETKHGRPT